MADKKISQLTAATLPFAGTEVLPIVQSSTTLKVSVNDLAAGNLKSQSTTGVLQVSGPAAGTTRVMTVPNANFTAARTDTSQTFTGNQTFSADVISSNGKLAVTGNGQTVALQLDGYVPGNTLDGYICNNDNSSGALATLAFGRASSLLFGYVRSNNNSQALELGTIDQFSQVRTNRFVIGSTGDATMSTGNIIQGTAAKGINFTANTPAAGMTSQLLNWYEEGTWTPNQGAGLTVVGDFSSSGTYTRIGRQVFVRGSVSGATSVAVASAGVISTNLPYSAGADATGAAVNAANNASSVLRISSATLTAVTAIAATTTITFSATYSV